MLTVTAGQLRAALGVTSTLTGQKAYVVSGLNLRYAPTTLASIVRLLNAGEVLSLTTIPVYDDGSHKWTLVQVSNGVYGWVAGEFLSSTPPNTPTPPVVPPVTPPKPISNRIGLHVLQDGTVDAEMFINAVHPPSMTYINAIDAANKAVALGVPWVVFRSVPGPDGDKVLIPEDDPTLSYNTGRQTVQSRWGQFSTLDQRVKIQITSERPWSPGHADFWRGVMDELEARGYRAAIGAFSVGTPEPEQWAKMVPALTQAKSNGHCVVLHSYCEPNTPAGQLSPAGEGQYYELRFARLYAAVPPEARPPLIMSEFAGEFSRGKFQGTDNLIKLCGLYGAAISAYDYFVAFNLWTAGVEDWADASINSALPTLATWIKSAK